MSDKLFDILVLDLKSTWTTLLDLDSFYGKLYLELKETTAILLDFGLSWMVLQKYEYFLELSVRELYNQL